MGWKNWPYWFKGGIISLLIWLILVVLSGIVDFLIPGFIPPVLPFLQISRGSVESRHLISTGILYIYMGMIIGGLIRSKKVQIKQKSLFEPTLLKTIISLFLGLTIIFIFGRIIIGLGAILITYLIWSLIQKKNLILESSETERSN